MLEDTVEMHARKAKAREFNGFIDRVCKELTMPESNFRAIVRILMANPGRLTTEAIIKLIFDASDDFLSAAQSAELISRLRGIAIHRIRESPAPYARTRLAFAHAVGLVEWLSMLSCDRWNLAPGTHYQGACHYVVTRISMAPPVDCRRFFPRHYFGLDWGETYTYPEARQRIMRSVLERLRGGLTYHGSPAIQPRSVDAIVSKLQARVQRRLVAPAQATGGIASPLPKVSEKQCKDYAGNPIGCDGSTEFLEFLARDLSIRGPVLPQPKLITGGEMRPLALTLIPTLTLTLTPTLTLTLTPHRKPT